MSRSSQQQPSTPWLKSSSSQRQLWTVWQWQWRKLVKHGSIKNKKANLQWSLFKLLYSEAAIMPQKGYCTMNIKCTSNRSSAIDTLWSHWLGHTANKCKKQSILSNLRLCSLTINSAEWNKDNRFIIKPRRPNGGLWCCWNVLGNHEVKTQSFLFKNYPLGSNSILDPTATLRLKVLKIS